MSLITLGATAHAEEAADSALAETKAVMPAQTQKSMLTPNLTVNFQLNSTLGEKETAYYAKIVDRILKGLPKKIELDGDERDLLSGSDIYDTLKVVAYFPTSGEERADDPFNKIAKTYNIQFELPKENRLKRLVKSGDASPTMVVSKVSLDEFMAQQGEGASASEVSKTSEELVAATTQAAQLPAVESAKVAAKTAAVQKSKVAEVKVVKPKVVLQKARLDFYGDEQSLSGMQEALVKKLAESYKSSGSQTLKVVTASAPTPFTKWQDVRDSRLKAIQDIFSAYGVKLTPKNVNYVHVRSTLKQYVDIAF
ncbi:MAG: hypothetical protein VX154_01895 [Pseudomonadota bacterium]|nr:hypothetical protein [Pseudomonadota bacterium]